VLRPRFFTPKTQHIDPRQALASLVYEVFPKMRTIPGRIHHQ
jgi:hypothetical protein